MMCCLGSSSQRGGSQVRRSWIRRGNLAAVATLAVAGLALGAQPAVAAPAAGGTTPATGGTAERPAQVDPHSARPRAGQRALALGAHTVPNDLLKERFAE